MGANTRSVADHSANIRRDDQSANACSYSNACSADTRSSTEFSWHASKWSSTEFRSYARKIGRSLSVVGGSTRDCRVPRNCLIYVSESEEEEDDETYIWQLSL